MSSDPKSVSPGIHPSARTHPTAIIESGVSIGAGSAAWDNVHIRKNTQIGENCIIGSGCVITDNRVIPPGKLVVGVPGKIVGDVSPEMQKAKVVGTKIYQTLPRRYKSTLKQIG